MPRFSAASNFDHAMPERTAVLLVQLGTPDAPETSAVRRYLREFLSDPRVVEIPRLVWALILNGIILNVRPARSAEKYATIWTEQGSPLALHTANQAQRLSQALEARGHSIEVAWAMRYGRPSISQVMQAMRERNVTRLLVLPLYPQYAASTTATAFDAVFAELAGWRNQPELRTVRNFHDHGPYIEALARHVEAYWAREGKPDVLVMSFHGVPRRSLLLGDPYHCECLATGRLLAERLQLEPSQFRVTFQSRFGKAEWLRVGPRDHLTGDNPWHTFRLTTTHDFLHAGGFLVVGGLAAAALNVLVPQDWLGAVADNPLLSILALAALAVILCICSEADAFVAASLTEFSLTAKLAFLVVGPMVDLKLVSLQVGTFGRRFAFRFAPTTFVVAVLASVVVGWWLLT